MGHERCRRASRPQGPACLRADRPAEILSCCIRTAYEKIKGHAYVLLADFASDVLVDFYGHRGTSPTSLLSCSVAPLRLTWRPARTCLVNCSTLTERGQLSTPTVTLRASHSMRVGISPLSSSMLAMAKRSTIAVTSTRSSPTSGRKKRSIARLVALATYLLALSLSRHCGFPFRFVFHCRSQ